MDKGKDKLFDGTQEEWDNLTRDEIQEYYQNKSKTDYKDLPVYKNASKEDKLSMDNKAILDGEDELMRHIKAIAEGNAKTFAEAVEYNANIDAQQESINQDSDKMSAGLTLANTVTGMGTAMAMRNRGDKELDQRTKEILGNVAPTIEKSQALTNALSQAQYQAGAGMPSEIQGAINEQDRYDYENALDQVRGASNQGSNAMNNLMFNNALRANRGQAQMDLQYRNQALQNRNNLIASDQAINTAQGGMNAQNNMAKLAFLNKRADRASELKESGLMGVLNKGNELASGAANAYKLGRTINARNAILSPQTEQVNNIAPVTFNPYSPNQTVRKNTPIRFTEEGDNSKVFSNVPTYSGVTKASEIPWWMETDSKTNNTGFLGYEA